MNGIIYNKVQLKAQFRLKYLFKKQQKTRYQQVFCVSGFDSGWGLWSALGACALFSEVLQLRSRGSVSPPVAAICLGACMSWSGIIPHHSIIYATIQQTLVPFALALFLIEQPIQRVFDAGVPMLICFAIGTFGTLLGTIIAWQFGSQYLPTQSANKIAAALCATYIGGTLNFVAVSQVLNIGSSEIIAAALAADSVGMAIYLAVLSVWPVKRSGNKVNIYDGIKQGGHLAANQMGVLSAFTIAAFVCCLSTWLSAKLGSPNLMLAFIPVFAFAFNILNIGAMFGGFQGCGVIASCIMQLFFVTIGASVGSLQVLFKNANILLFIAIQLLVHVIVVVTGGMFLQMPFDKLLIASNANIGGPATASAMAISRGWNELAFPGIVLGSLGYMIGTACGLQIIQFLK